MNEMPDVLLSDESSNEDPCGTDPERIVLKELEEADADEV
jgi:hypothetical protein